MKKEDTKKIRVFLIYISFILFGIFVAFSQSDFSIELYPTNSTFNGDSFTNLTDEISFNDTLTWWINKDEFVDVHSWNFTFLSDFNITNVTALCLVKRTDKKGEQLFFRVSTDRVFDTEPEICGQTPGTTGLFYCDLFSNGIDTYQELNNLTLRCINRDSDGNPPGSLEIDMMRVLVNYAQSEEINISVIKNYRIGGYYKYPIAISNYDSIPNSYTITLNNFNNSDYAELNTNITPILNPGETYNVELTVGSMAQGTYSYTVDVVSNNNPLQINSISLDIEITAILDTQAPVINSINDSPDPVNLNDLITITANITDDIKIDSAWVNINNLNHSLNNGNSIVILFFDGFESGSLVNWTLITVGGGNPWTNSTINPYQGIYHAQSQPMSTNEPASIMEKAISTSNYQNIELSYYRKLVNLDTADEFKVEWFNGTSWNVLEETGSNSANDVNYTYKKFSLPLSADNNPNFKIRFECTAGAVTEYCRIDNFMINATSSSDSWSYTYNTTGLSIGLYNYIIYANDTSNNLANPQNGSFSIISNITDTTSPSYSNIIEPSDPSIYNFSQNYEFNISWTDDVNIDSIIINFNGTNYTDAIQNGNVWSKTFTDLAVGTYNYIWYANDTSNNWNNTGNLIFNINKTSPALTLTSTPSWNETYGTQTAINCTSNTLQIIPNLYRNGVLVSIPDTQLLGAGTYNYECNASGNQNYTSGQVLNNLIINKAVSILNLILNNQNDNISIQTGNSVIINSELINPTQGYIEIYQNNVLINNGSSPLTNTITYDTVGTYNITLIYLETTNYTLSYKTYFIEVSAAPAQPPGGGGGGGSEEPKQELSQGEVKQEIKNELSNLFATMLPNTEYIININNPELALNQVSVTVKNEVNNGELYIVKLSKEQVENNLKETDIIKYINNTYDSFEINSNLADNIEKILIRFSVKKSWLNEHNIDKGMIIMYRYHDKPETLDTWIENENSDEVQYAAKSKGLSMFIIIGEEPLEKPLNKVTGASIGARINSNEIIIVSLFLIAVGYLTIHLWVSKKRKDIKIKRKNNRKKKR